jgi:hypothetical protein
LIDQLAITNFEFEFAFEFALALVLEFAFDFLVNHHLSSLRPYRVNTSGYLKDSVGRKATLFGMLPDKRFIGSVVDANDLGKI